MYEDLRKLSYKLEHKEYEAIFKTRFQSGCAVHLNFDIKGNQAFFVVLPEMLTMISEIYRIDKKIAKICAALPKVALKQFAQKCLVDEIVLTNKIEGVRSTRREIGEIINDLYEKSSLVYSKQRFTGLVRNYMLLSMIENDETISLEFCEDIRKLYDALVLNEVKEDDEKHIPDGRIFRKGAVGVETATGKMVHQGMYPEEKIVEYMNKALYVLEDASLEVLIRIVIFHYLYEYIHPFYDGNGRLGRYILSSNIREELEPVLAYRLSYTIHEREREYEEAFEICNNPRNKGDLTPFILVMFSFIKQSVVNLQIALDKRKHLFDEYLSKISVMMLRLMRCVICCCKLVCFLMWGLGLMIYRWF